MLHGFTIDRGPGILRFVCLCTEIGGWFDDPKDVRKDYLQHYREVMGVPGESVGADADYSQT